MFLMTCQSTSESLTKILNDYHTLSTDQKITDAIIHYSTRPRLRLTSLYKQNISRTIYKQYHLYIYTLLYKIFFYLFLVGSLCYPYYAIMIYCWHVNSTNCKIMAKSFLILDFTIPFYAQSWNLHRMTYQNPTAKWL